MLKVPGREGKTINAIIAKVSLNQFSREKLLTNISGKLSTAIAFKGYLRSDFSIAVFIRDRKALELKNKIRRLGLYNLLEI
ncbi:unnamed protein product [Fusarium fujikuroi]|nr:unnamed protein product [Fusarium fujikuroi]